MKNMKLLLMSFALIFSLLIMGVFAEDWPMFMHDSNHTSSNGEHYIIGSLTFTQIANFSTGNAAVGNTLASSPAVYKGIVYVGLDNYTYALNATTLNQIANFTTGDGFIESSPAVSNGIVYVGSGGSSNHDVYALNAVNLNQIASFTSGGIFLSSPTVSNGIVYILSTDDNIYALNATNLNQIANFSIGYSLGWSSPAASNGIVYIGSDNGDVYALNATNLNQVANFSVSTFFDSSPAVSNGVVYIAGENNYFYALNATTMKQITNASITALAFSSPAVSNGIVYVGSESTNGEVYALNATTLNQIANFSTGSNSVVYASPAVSNGIVYVGAGIRSSLNGNVFALNATNLNQIAKFSAGYYISSPAVSNGIVYVGSEFNNVYALSLDGSFESDPACVVPFNGMVVNQSVMFCSGSYNVANGSFTSVGIFVNASNIVLQCNQTVLVGNNLNGFGIDVLSVNNVTVEGCSITGFYDPLYINNSIGDLILNNNIMNNPGDGLIAGSVSNSLFSNNTIENNIVGGLDLTSFFNNIVSNNLLLYNGNNYLDYSENSNFINNTVIGGFAALDVSFYNNSSSLNNLFSGNTIMNATYGIYIDTGAHNNTFSSNIFSNNGKDIWTYGGGVNTLILSSGTNQVAFYNKYLNITNMSDIFINDSLVYMDSAAEPAMNTSATATIANPTGSCSPVPTLYSTPTKFSSTNIGSICNAASNPACTNIICTPSTITFDVNHFTSYATANYVNSLAACTTPIDAMNITQNMTLCSGYYNLPDGIFIRSSNLVLDCNGAMLNGISVWSHRGITVNGASNVVIKNCKLLNYSDGIATFNGGSAITIENNILQNPVTNRDSNNGIIFSGVTYNSTILNNFVNGSTYGIHVQENSYGDSVINNTVTGSTLGIMLSGNSTNNIVSGNILYGIIDRAIQIEQSSNSIISGNVVNGSRQGIVTDSGTIGVTVSNNGVVNIVDQGLALMNVNDSSFLENNITNATTGIGMIGAINNTIANNTIQNATVGINIMSNNVGNTITNNTFVGVTQNTVGSSSGNVIANVIHTSHRAQVAVRTVNQVVPQRTVATAAQISNVQPQQAKIVVVYSQPTYTTSQGENLQFVQMKQNSFTQTISDFFNSIFASIFG